MIRRATRRFLDDALKPERLQIQFVGEEVDRPARIVLAGIVVGVFWKQNAPVFGPRLQ